MNNSIVICKVKFTITSFLISGGRLLNRLHLHNSVELTVKRIKEREINEGSVI